MRLEPGIAAVVSEKIRSGGWAGHKGFRTENVGDKAGCHLGDVAGACGGQRQRAERGSGGEDEDEISSGHMGLRRDASARAGQDAGFAGSCSPDLEIALAETGDASPIPKFISDYNLLEIRLRWP